jgi:acetyl-CoA synthetase
MLPAATYADAIATFRWEIPAHYNIGVDVADKHVLEGRGDPTLRRSPINSLVAHGIRSGDRVAILLPQRPETAIGHVAIYKAGMIAVPLFTLFGPDALEFRLTDSGARALITDAASLEKTARIRAVAVDERTKREAETVLAPLGVTSSEFLRRVVERIARQPTALIALARAARTRFPR